MCGTVSCWFVGEWCGFGLVSLRCVWERLGRDCGSEFVLCVGEIGAGLGE